MKSNNNYYELLNIKPDAESKEIRTAFRKVIRDIHPDVSKNPRAAERTRLIMEAYKTLRDPVKRLAYNQQALKDRDWWDKVTLENEGSIAVEMIPTPVKELKQPFIQWQSIFRFLSYALIFALLMFVSALVTGGRFFSKPLTEVRYSEPLTQRVTNTDPSFSALIYRQHHSQSQENFQAYNNLMNSVNKAETLEQAASLLSENITALRNAHDSVTLLVMDCQQCVQSSMNLQYAEQWVLMERYYLLLNQRIAAAIQIAVSYNPEKSKDDSVKAILAQYKEIDKEYDWKLQVFRLMGSNLSRQPD